MMEDAYKCSELLFHIMNERLQGVYTLLINILRPFQTRVGELGTIGFEEGFYVYNGSALGPGGLKARLRRHLRVRKALKWHIDYLLSSEAVKIKAILYHKTRERLECKVNLSLSRLGIRVVEGFGSSDCKAGCKGHLIYLGRLSAEEALNTVLKAYRKLSLLPTLIPNPSSGFSGQQSFPYNTC